MSLNLESGSYIERHTHRSMCPKCGRFLTRSMVRISILGNSEAEVARYREMVKISYGSETKCKSCKYIGKTETVAEKGKERPLPIRS